MPNNLNFQMMIPKDYRYFYYLDSKTLKKTAQSFLKYLIKINMEDFKK